MKAKTAASAFGAASTGGTFMIMLCRPGTSYFQVKSGFTIPLNQPVPQIATITERMIHGSQAMTISRDEAVRPPTWTFGRSPGTPAPREAGRGSP